MAATGWTYIKEVITHVTIAVRKPFLQSTVQGHIDTLMQDIS